MQRCIVISLDRKHLKTAFAQIIVEETNYAQITCMVFMDKTKSKVYCFLQSECSVYFNKIMKSKHILGEYRILFLSKFLQICIKFDRPVY